MFDAYDVFPEKCPTIVYKPVCLKFILEITLVYYAGYR